MGLNDAEKPQATASICLDDRGNIPRVTVARRTLAAITGTSTSYTDCITKPLAAATLARVCTPMVMMLI